ncbi:energy-coupling factor transporter ATP-binding protein EcfA2 [Catenulispora sp. GAS73]
MSSVSDPLGQLLARVEHLRSVGSVYAAGWWPQATAALGSGATASTAGRHWACRLRIRAQLREARLIRILLPASVDQHSGTAFWANLHGLVRPPRRRIWPGQPHLSFEYSFSSAGVHIQMWVPGSVPPSMIERAIEAAWPGAQTETVLSAGAPVPSQPQLVRAVGGRLRLARQEIHPLQDRYSSDPLRALLGACADLGTREHAAVQVLARPAAGRRLRRFRSALRSFRKAPTSRNSVKTTLFDLTTPGLRGKTTTVRADLEHSAELRAAMAKSVGPLWETVVYYVVTTTAPASTTAAERRSDVGRLRGLAHAIASSYAVHAERNWWARKPMPGLVRAVTERRFVRGDLLNLTELAAIAHLPFDPDAPGISRAGARSVPVPPAIPGPSSMAKPLGRSDAGGARQIGLGVAEARQHLHIVGKTGCGKSSLLANLALADVEAGRGAVVIDPKGDLVRAVLERLPERAVGRTVLIDPEYDGIRPTMNVLRVENNHEIPLVVDNLVGIFHKIYGAYWGPRTDDILRSTALTLLKSRSPGHPPTLMDIPALLTAGDAARSAITSRVQDPMLGSFWDWYSQLSDGARAQVIGPLMNKLRAFLLRDFVRQTVAAPTSNFDMAKVLNGGVLLVRIPKGVLGDETTRLLGSLAVAGVWQKVQARARQLEADRADSALYLDEGQNFLTLAHPLEDMFAEARAYRLSITFAHQNLGQLSTELRETLSANARTKVYFNASPEDSRLMERHTVPTLTAYDLSNLGEFQAAARLVTGGQESRAFTFRTAPLSEAVPGRAEAVLAAAAAQWPAAAKTPTPRLVADPRTPRGLDDTLELDLDPESLRQAGGSA